MSYGDWEPVIGLEIHAQLNTNSKIFSSDSAQFGGGDNENISAVSLGLPGTLPVLNEGVVERSIKIGLALNCEINLKSIFARKNYFYPDLPKGYQISQFEEPICKQGWIEVPVEGELKKIGITRAHMEEDAGKSTHHGNHSLVNLNRAGVPLLEIVSDPVIHSPSEAAEYARSIRSILRYLEVCDGNLEEGSMRCDCNVSVRKKGTDELNTRVEIKNLNSFRFIEKAVDFEIRRQIDANEIGEKLVQETRLYDSTKNKTFTMRTKEEADDYRYFPDPDLLPVILEQSDVDKIKSELPELPQVKAKRFQDSYKLPEYDSLILVQEKALAEYFEKAAAVCKNAKLASNWVMSDVLRELKGSDSNVEDIPLPAADLGELLLLIEEGTISGKIAKDVFTEMWTNGGKAADIVEKKGLKQITDTSAIEAIVDAVLARSESQVNEYKSGKQKVFGFFVGQVMKETKGQASPELVNKLLKEKLK